MVRRWLRRLVLWALREETPFLPPAPAAPSARLYEEWLYGAQKTAQKED